MNLQVITSRLAALLIGLIGFAMLWPLGARAGLVAMDACMSGTGLSVDWTHADNPTFGTNLEEVDNCGSNGRFQIVDDNASGSTAMNDSGQWTTVLPSDMSLTAAAIPAGVSSQEGALINPATANNGGSSGFNVRYLWNGGDYRLQDAGSCCGGMDYASPWSQSISGRYFIVQVACTLSACQLPTTGVSQIVDVKNVQLVASDNVPPTITFPTEPAGSAPNIAAQSGWVRGDGWTLAADASNGDASGVCQLSVKIDGALVQSPIEQAPDTTRWLQCPADVPFSEAFNTTALADGSHPLEVDASDAAAPANVATVSIPLQVDNAPVGLDLTGPADTAVDSDADAKAVVSAQASAGPSGIGGIFCSVDGGAFSLRGADTAQIAVTGLGHHTVRCYAQNRALNAQGQTGQSPLQEFDLLIRQMTTEVAGFRRIVGLRCRRIRARRRMPGHWPPIHRFVRRCGGRTIHRRVTVVVIRHGRPVRIRRIVRIVVPPRTIQKRVLRVAHGKFVTVSGYLGLADGTPLADQPIDVWATPRDDASPRASLYAVRTGPLGTWSATLPPGPSRRIQVTFAGSDSYEPITSGQLVLTVPARIRLLRVTRHVAWGGTVHLLGRLYGGYLPRSGAIVRLRYGYGRARATFGVLHVGGNGTFATTFRFGPGPSHLRARYWFSASLVPHADYPYGAASSPRRYVIVGGG